MPIAADADPNARARCPRCKALVLVADWRDHDAWDRQLLERLDAAEAALLEPAPEPELADWPAEPEPDTHPAGPYADAAPEPAGGPQL